MLPKKSKKADLERNRGVFLQIAMIMALSIVLIAFDWKSQPGSPDQTNYFNQIQFEPDGGLVMQRIELKPEIKKPKIEEIIEIVPNDAVIDDNNFFNPETTPDKAYDIYSYNNDPDDIVDPAPFIFVEEMPRFNGGKPEKEFMKYISENLVYPQIAADNGAEGKVYVQFVVDRKGNISDAIVLLSADPALDREALRVITSSPAWTPGKQGGKPVRVQYTFPINFVLR